MTEDTRSPFARAIDDTTHQVFLEAIQGVCDSARNNGVSEYSIALLLLHHAGVVGTGKKVDGFFFVDQAIRYLNDVKSSYDGMMSGYAERRERRNRRH